MKLHLALIIILICTGCKNKTYTINKDDSMYRARRVLIKSAMDEATYQINKIRDTYESYGSSCGNGKPKINKEEEEKLNRIRDSLKIANEKHRETLKIKVEQIQERLPVYLNEMLDSFKLTHPKYKTIKMVDDSTEVKAKYDITDEFEEFLKSQIPDKE